MRPESSSAKASAAKFGPAGNHSNDFFILYIAILMVRPLLPGLRFWGRPFDGHLDVEKASMFGSVVGDNGRSLSVDSNG